MTLRKVGYWRSTSGLYPELPIVADSVDPSWAGDRPAERAAVEKHMDDTVRAGFKSGSTRGFRGMSTCRVCGGFNGSQETNDGVWIWPLGLRHYIVAHDVRPPQDFIDHCVRSVR